MPMVHLFWCMWLVYSYSSIYLSSSKRYTLQWMMTNLNCTKVHFFIMCPELLWFAFMYIIGLPHAKSCFLILKCVCWTRSVLVQKRVWLDTVTLTVLMNVRMRGWAAMLLVSAVHIVKMVRTGVHKIITHCPSWQYVHDSDRKKISLDFKFCDFTNFKFHLSLYVKKSLNDGIYNWNSTIKIS